MPCMINLPVQAPIAVYTSGKGSSAAGLTASVIRDAAGEFYLEVPPLILQPSHAPPTPGSLTGQACWS